MSGSGISWAIYKSAPHSRQITSPAPDHSGRTHFLPPNQQHQSTEGNKNIKKRNKQVTEVKHKSFSVLSGLITCYYAISCWTVSTHRSLHIRRKFLSHVHGGRHNHILRFSQLTCSTLSGMQSCCKSLENQITSRQSN